MGSMQTANTVDLSHHINASSKARHPSPLKEIIKYMAVDGMVSLAGGKQSIQSYLSVRGKTYDSRPPSSISISISKGIF